jgi:hypothetical protein
MANNIVPKDFVFDTAKTHANLSQRGTARLLKVSQSSISRFVENDALGLGLDPKSLLEYGFDGDALIEAADHFASSSKVKPEIRQHCKQVFKKAAKIGAQLFIDSLAGVDPTQKRLPCRILDQPTPWQQLYEEEFCDRVFKWFGAQFYWEFAYCFLTPIEVCRLNELNPPNKGDRKHRIHQYLEPDTRKRLEPHVLQLIAICNASEDKEQFLNGYRRHFNKANHLKLALQY